MLQNFTDEEIEHELLETGYLFYTDTEGDNELIEKQAVEHPVTGAYMRSIYKHCYTMKGSGERAAPYYRNLKELMYCEQITFDDIRAKWQYHGVLLGMPKFQEKLKACMTNDTALAIGQEVEWLTRPMAGGYLHGIITKIGPNKIKIRIQSPKTGEWKEKWAEARYLRKIEGKEGMKE